MHTLWPVLLSHGDWQARGEAMRWIGVLAQAQQLATVQGSRVRVCPASAHLACQRDWHSPRLLMHAHAQRLAMMPGLRHLCGMTWRPAAFVAQPLGGTLGDQGRWCFAQQSDCQLMCQALAQGDTSCSGVWSVVVTHAGRLRLAGGRAKLSRG